MIKLPPLVAASTLDCCPISGAFIIQRNLVPRVGKCVARSTRCYDTKRRSEGKWVRALNICFRAVMLRFPGWAFVYERSAKPPLGACHAVIVIPASYDANLVASFKKMPISTRFLGFPPFFLGWSEKGGEQAYSQGFFASFFNSPYLFHFTT